MTDPPFEAQLLALRPRLLERIRTRMSPTLLALSDPDDVLQDATLTAKRLIDARGAWRGYGLYPWMARIAENEIRNLVRRSAPKRRPRRNSPLPLSLLRLVEKDEIEGRASVGAGHVASLELNGPMGSMRGLSWDHRVAVTVRESLSLQLDTLAFLTRRETTGSARKLVHRAQRRMGP